MRIILVLTFIVDGPGTCDFRKTCATQEERFKVKQCPRNREMKKNKLEVVSKIATTSPTEENVKQASQQESKRRKCEISMTTRVQPKKM